MDKPPGSVGRGWETMRGPLWRFAVFIVVLSICFAKPISDLARLAFNASLYSHVLLVPFISLYLVWLRRGGLPVGPVRPAPFAAVPFLLGLAGIISYAVARARGFNFGLDDYLAITISSFVCFIAGGGLLFMGSRLVRALAFPLAFLVFMIPFPATVTRWIEIFFQHTSADASHLLFLLSGTPVFRLGTTFQLPGLVIRVAEECSGIRSSLVLFITSLIAGYMFLRRPWKRAVLTLAVIPLGIVRNAIRVFTITMLSIHVDPQVIHSPIHTRGGPLFFLMSLVPFFLLLLWLRKSEQPRAGALPGPGESQAGKSVSTELKIAKP